MERIPYNKPYLTGKELNYIRDVCSRGVFAANGDYTQKCNDWLEQNTGAAQAVLTRSCTDALEMAALLTKIRPGDEIILPSYSYISTANAFVLFGATPVFVDIREDTLNVDETKIEASITPKTKAIAVTHYAGISAEMDAIMPIGRKHNLLVIEDAAQALLSTYKGKSLGSIGHMASLSFHETKNIIAGEGGAILINDKKLIEKTAVISQKGTNRAQFLNGEVDKYTWLDKGSSYMPGELTAAFLLAQMESTVEITQRRKAIWEKYHEALKDLEDRGLLRRPQIPKNCEHNGHIYYILLKDTRTRDTFIRRMNDKGIHCVFHFVPLHQSSGGKRFGRVGGGLKITEDLSSRLVRLPLWVGIEKHLERIIDEIRNELE